MTCARVESGSSPRYQVPIPRAGAAEPSGRVTVRIVGAVMRGAPPLAVLAMSPGRRRRPEGSGRAPAPGAVDQVAQHDRVALVLAADGHHQHVVLVVVGGVVE